MLNLKDKIANLSPEKRALLERHIATKEAEAAGRWSIPPRQDEGPAPLSFAQERLWFLQQLDPNSARYNIPRALRLRGAVNVSALQRALEEIVTRHQILRTNYIVQNGAPVQVVARKTDFPLPQVDLSVLPAADREARAMRLCREETTVPFDLADDRLIRGLLIRLGPDEQILFLTMHHIVSDGWSREILGQELTSLYMAFRDGLPSPLPPLPIQYADYAVWQRDWLRGETLERQIAYWKERLAGAPALLELPGDRPRPSVPSYAGATTQATSSGALLQPLQDLARSEGATLFMTLLAAFNVLLSRYSGQEDIVVGSPIANRNRKETEGLIGFFVNMLALRTDLSGDPSFRELLRRVRDTAQGAYAHQDLPFEKLVEEMAPERSLSHSPLFQVMFTVQTGPARAQSTGGSRAREGDEVTTAKYDLSLTLTSGADGLHCLLEYSTDLFDRERMQRLLGHYLTILEGLVAAPDLPISRLPLLTEPERAQILVDWNATQANFPTEHCIHTLFEEQALRTPDAVALDCAGRTLTYSELNEQADRLAHRLRVRGIGPEARVGLCLNRSPEMVVGLLGILKAGGAYVPLDPAYPRERLDLMMQDSQVALVITVKTLRDRLTGIRPEQLLHLDGDEDARTGRSNPHFAPNVQPGNLAYVIYTSGSTGRPKGVAITHASAVALLSWTQTAFRDEEMDGVLASTSLCFDLSVFELFAPLCRGGRVVLVQNVLELAGNADAASTEISGPIRLINTVPSAMAELLRLNAVPATVKSVALAGEPLSADLVRRIYALGHVERVVDLYGPTEDTTYSTWAVRESDMAPTIGRPIANTQAYVLDRHLQPLPVGVPGELYLGGAGLARGYLNRPDLTAERFIASPFPHSPAGRLYRTGDLVRWRSDGSLEYLGRIDHQVKVRGFRIELGEIESALLSHPDVDEAVVLAREDRPGDRRLVAYLVVQRAIEQTGMEATARALREHLRATLPDYMVPSAFMALDTLPRTPNGKVDRKALPAPNAMEAVSYEVVAPRTPIEEGLVEIWSAILNREVVSADANFFELGGHSLLATQVISRIRSTFQVELPLRALFEAPTVADLAQRVSEELGAQSGVSAPPLIRASREGALPLSFAQQRLWFLEQLEPGSSVYHLPLALRLTGALNVEALEASLAEIVRRHEALRTVFTLEEGAPSQQITEPDFTLARGRLPGLEAVALEDPSREEQVRTWVGEEARRPFDLQRGPLFRASLLEVREGEHVLVLTMHHIVADGWSMGVLTRELSALYAAYSARQDSPLGELPLQYADYAVWQRGWLQGEVLEDQLGYWKSRLSGAPALLELPTDRPRPAVQTYRGERIRAELSAELTQGLRSLCRATDTTLFMALLGALNLLLSRYSGQDDVVVGTSIAGRTRSELEGLIGFFVNTLALRTDLSGDPSFVELLGRVREEALGAYAHQEVPFEKLVEELQPERSLSHAPIFQVMFTLQNAPRSGGGLTDLRMQAFTTEHKITKYDLGVVVSEGVSGLSLTLEYSTELFDAERMERLLGHFETLLTHAVASPESRISRLPLMSEPERQQVLVEWNNGRAEFPQGRCLHHLFEQQVERTPDAVAVEFEGEALTYRELEARSNQLAHYLVRQGAGVGDPVGLCVERSLALPIALLGILKAGASYVPLDTSYPKDRIAYMLRNSNMKLLVAQETVLDLLPTHTADLVCVDRDRASIAAESMERVPIDVDVESVAYVIYTSGSTGQPKGVMIPHRAIVNRMTCTAQFSSLTGSDRVLQKTAMSFDASVWEFWAPLIVGAALVFARPGIQADLSLLVRTIAEKRITTLVLVPSVLELLLEEGDLAACKHLRWVICGGEALTHAVQERFFARMRPGMELHNLYGPTEAAVDTTSFACVPGATSPIVPIGWPLYNVRVYVLDGALQPVPIGIPGELYVGGVQLAHGYLNRPELTAERFVPDPFSGVIGGRLYRTGDLVHWRSDGALAFIGRIDHQVKIRGFRIELGEIESLLKSHPSVGSAVVIVREDLPGDRRLAAYVSAEVGTGEPSDSTEIAESAGGSCEPPLIRSLRSYLEERLPGYMLPSALTLLPALPLMPNGKVDRKALPAPDYGRRDQEVREEPPQNPIEQKLAEIWAEILRQDAIGRHDSFFKLGGHSLLAVQMIARARKAFRVDLPLRVLFEAPTLAGLAERIAAQIGGETPTSVPEVSVTRITPGGAGPGLAPMFCVAAPGVNALGYAALGRRLGDSHPLFVLQSHNRIARDRPYSQEELQQLASQYIQAMRELYPEGPYCLGGMCEGAHLSFEMARQLQEAGEQVPVLMSFDAWPEENTRTRFGWWLTWMFRTAEHYRKNPSVGIGWCLRRVVAFTVRAMREWLLLPFRPPAPGNWEARYWPGRSFVPPRFKGRITVMRVRRQNLYRIQSHDLGWSPWATEGTEVFTLPGDHTTLFREPQVAEVAAIVMRQLDRVQSAIHADASTGRSGAETYAVVSADLDPVGSMSITV
jgi:amino acid adenylation domain-containing protein